MRECKFKTFHVYKENNSQTKWVSVFLASLLIHFEAQMEEAGEEGDAYVYVLLCFVRNATQDESAGAE